MFVKHIIFIKYKINCFISNFKMNDKHTSDNMKNITK